MFSKLILATERRRRTITVLIAAVVGLVYFYEYPLYALLNVYSRFQGWDGLEPLPPLETLDLLVAGAIVLGILEVFFVPRSYVRADESKDRFDVVIKGRRQEPVTRRDLAKLEFKLISERKTASRDSGYVESTCIYCRPRPDIVFYDAVSSRQWWREKQVARALESALGEVQWTDRSGVLSGKPDADHDARVEKREKQRSEVAGRQRPKPGKVIKGYGMRTFMMVFLGAFAVLFWIGESKIAGGIFAALVVVLALDLVLSILGVGQQPGDERRDE